MYGIYTRCRFLTELFLSLVIFYYLLETDQILKEISFDSIVYTILSYIVILELIKMLGQYIFDRRFNMILVIDTFFIFVLRETILIYSNKHYDKLMEIFRVGEIVIVVNEKIFYIVIGIFMMLTLIYIRGNNKFYSRKNNKKRGKRGKRDREKVFFLNHKIEV